MTLPIGDESRLRGPEAADNNAQWARAFDAHRANLEKVCARLDTRAYNFFADAQELFRSRPRGPGYQQSWATSTSPGTKPGTGPVSATLRRFVGFITDRAASRPGLGRLWI